MKPEISIITVGMNHLSYVKEMLASLYSVGSPSVSFEVIFVDNCSTDGTADYIRNNYPTIKLIENQKKYGFARNNNIGAKHAIGNYILILNPDIILTQGAIDKLYNYAIKHPSCGIVAPKLQNRDCSLQYSARRFPSIKILLNRALTKGNDKSGNKNVQTYLLKNLPMDTPTEVDWCMGAAFLISHTFYNELKGFDEKFFLYVEDMDICYRCWKKNKKVVYYPLSKMTHVHQRSSQRAWCLTPGSPAPPAPMRWHEWSGYGQCRQATDNDGRVRDASQCRKTDDTPLPPPYRSYQPPPYRPLSWFRRRRRWA